MRALLLLGSLAALAACGDERVAASTEAAAGPAASGGPAGAGSGGDGASDAGQGGAGGADGGSGGDDRGWQALPPLPGGPRQEHAVVARRGEVWTLGGFDTSGITTTLVEIFDPAERVWRVGPDLPLPMHHANVAVVGDRVLVLGSLAGLGFDPTGESWQLDDEDGTWAPRAPLPGGRARGASAVAVTGDEIVVCGGLRGAAVAECDLYDALEDTWSALPDLPAVRDHVVGAAIDGRVFVVGGREGTIPSIGGDVWELSADRDAWIERQPMRTPRAGAAATVLGGRIYVAGGEGNPDDPRGVFDDLEAYDPQADAWSALAPMPTPRHGAGMAAVAGLLVVPGGADAEGFAAVDVVEAYRP